MRNHIVQTKEWAEIKNKYGTEAVEAGGVFYTKHKIPKLNKYYAYGPRVNPFDIDVDALSESLRENNCVGLTFDVPNVFKGSEEEVRAEAILKKLGKKSIRSEFAKANVIMDISKSEKDLFESMHKKHRYNTRYAAKHGVVVDLAENDEDFEEFFELFKQTAIRQNYFIRPKNYYKIIWEELHPKGMCHILTAKKDDEPLASWMIFIHDNVLYYPYGGSSTAHRNLYASNALGWEVIRFGKSKGCEMFDMWGAADDPNNTKDDYYGFTHFKLKFGGEHVSYIPSYDLVINPGLYFAFTRLNNLRWKLLEAGLIK